MIFVYSCFLCICMHHISIDIILLWSYIHIDIFHCAYFILQCSCIFSTNWFHAKIDLDLNDKWYFYKLMHCFYWYFIKGEKNSDFIFQLVLFAIDILLPLFMMKNILFSYMLIFSVFVSIILNRYYSQFGIYIVK